MIVSDAKELCSKQSVRIVISLRQTVLDRVPTTCARHLSLFSAAIMETVSCFNRVECHISLSHESLFLIFAFRSGIMDPFLANAPLYELYFMHIR